MSELIGNDVKLKDKPTGIGYVALKMLPELWGVPWNKITYGIVMALEPDRLRVIPFMGEQKTDARHRRVTVHLRLDDTIDYIEQELAFNTYEGADLSGHGAKMYLEKHKVGG